MAASISPFNTCSISSKPLKTNINHTSNKQINKNIRAIIRPPLTSPSTLLNSPSLSLIRSKFIDGGFGSTLLKKFLHHETLHARKFTSVKTVAEVVKDDGVKWWEKDPPENFKDITSTQELIDALSNAGDKLVIVEFYGTWCGSCKALFPKLCQIARSRPDIDFYKINFDKNKPMCKRLNIRVLPYFHFYRGADGRLDAFSASITKLQRLKDAIEIHGTERCSLGPPLGVGDLDLVAGPIPTVPDLSTT